MSLSPFLIRGATNNAARAFLTQPSIWDLADRRRSSSRIAPNFYPAPDFIMDIDGAKTINDVFEEAKGRFEASLSSEEQAELRGFHSAQDMIANVASWGNCFQGQSRKVAWFSRSMKKIRRFSDALQSYFDIFTIIVSSHPEYAALALGAVRLALKLAWTYSTFFERLSETLETLTEKIPRYNMMYMLLRADMAKVGNVSVDLRCSLCSLYLSLIGFFQAVINVFRRGPNEGPRNPAKVATKLLWKPFDVRFGDLLKDIEKHTLDFESNYSLLRHSIQTACNREQASERESAKHERSQASAARHVLDSAYNKISTTEELLLAQNKDRIIQLAQRWLASPGYAQVYENLRETRYGETASWLFEESAFHLWQEANKEPETVEPEHGIDPRLEEHGIDPSLQGQDVDAQDSQTSTGAKGSAAGPVVEPSPAEDMILTTEGPDTEGKKLEESTSPESVQGVPQAQIISHILWVHGNPGAGKSVLAASTVEYLFQLDQDITVCYFFLSEQDPAFRTAAAAYRSLLNQILRSHGRNPRVLDLFALASWERPSSQDTATSQELQDLLYAVVRCVNECVFVIDGVDECDDGPELISFVHRFVREALAERRPRVILFSRPILRHGLAGGSGLTIEMGRSNQGDIELFLRDELEQLARNGDIPRDVDKSVLLQRLSTGADGMFLWARLMMVYLKAPALTRSQRVSTIMEVEFPEGLEVVYERLSRLISLKRCVERELASLVISTVAFAIRPLSCAETFELVKMNGREASQDEADYADFHVAVMVSCCGVIERGVLVNSRSGVLTYSYRLIHLSAKEFFGARGDMGFIPAAAQAPICASLLPGPVHSHFFLAARCLRYLTYHMPAQPLAGRKGENADVRRLDEDFPLSNYATLNWATHLDRVQDINLKDRGTGCLPDQRERYLDFLTTLASLMKQKLVVSSWIEASYTWGHAPTFEYVTRWAAGLDIVVKETDFRQLRKDIVDFDLYLRQLNDEWGERLHRSPSLLWEDEILAFTPCRLLNTAESICINHLVSEKPTNRDVFPRHLCKISEMTSDGDWIVILSIWPTKRFNAAFLEESSAIPKFRKAPAEEGEPKTSEIRSACSGWIARLEVWSTETPSERVAALEMHLDPTEVWIQIAQSLMTYRDPRGVLRWKVRFPIAIHPTGLYFTVLRTIYWLPSDVFQQRRRSVLVRSKMLPMEYESSRWEEHVSGALTLNFNENSRSPPIYLYSISFSTDGRFLCFTAGHTGGRLGLTVMIQQQASESGDVGFQQGRSVSSVIQCGATWADDFKLKFHGAWPTLAFLCQQRGYLWEFGIDNSAITQCYARFPRIDSVAFTHCGRYLVVNDSFGEYPVLMPLRESSTKFEMQLEQGDPGNKGDSCQTSRQRPTSNGLVHQTGTPRVVREDNGSLVLPQHVLRLGSSAGDRSALVCKRTASDGTSKTAELFKLPKWPHMDATNVAVKMPQSRAEMIKIVLNKTEAAWYAASDAPDNRLPAIAHVDQALMESRALPNRKRPQELEADKTKDSKRFRGDY
ncbi:hypothetical protein DL768_002772 [Monosporascus sp. mg162]|nr:hypothetical protein DL768_002772 [Monosporascus sp. mg162]